MKKITLLIIISAFFCGNIFSQTFDLGNINPKNKIDKVNEKGTWILDTINGYTGQSTSSWFWDYQEIVLSKNNDFYPLTIQSQQRDLNTSNWYKTYFLTNTYYSNNQFDEREWKEWNTNTNNWNTQLSLYEKYDEENKILEKFLRYWDNESQSFYQGNKEIYSYDENGVLISLQNKDWDYNSNNWVNWSTITYTYNTDGMLEHQIEVLTSGNYSQRFYTYNENNLLETETEQIWWEGAWLDYSRETNSYNTENLILEKMIENYDDSWYNAFKYTYTYFENGLLQQREEHDYLDANSSLLYEYTYDENGNETSFLLSDWNGSDWSLFYKVFDSYDENQNQTEYYSQAIDNGIWYNWLKEEYTWNHYGSTNIDNYENNIVIYPNPAKDFIQIKLPENQFNTQIKIYDINGKIVDVFDANHSLEKYNITDFQVGIYFVEIFSLGEKKSFRFIKN